MQACLAQQRLQYDSSKLITRNFDAEKIKAYLAEDAFQYNRYKEPPQSLWDRFWSWFWNRISELLSTEGGSTAFKTLLIILAVLVMAYFIYRLTGMNKVGLFKRNTGQFSDYSIITEDIHNIDFSHAIDQAIANGNYRMAVRLLYLQTLKRLTDKSLVNWQLNKTNIAYVQELDGRHYQSAFGELTLQFENNWYGDMPIDAAVFDAVRLQFTNFNRLI